MDEEQAASQDPRHLNEGKPRKAPVKSPYLFPAYGLASALGMAERVERDGGGVLEDSTLAINLGVSAKSSGYRLRHLAARQFGLMTKDGNYHRTTGVAKAIIKPTNPEERQRSLLEAFLNIPLFKAVAERYKGQPLPREAQTFRNVLEREFHIENSRVAAAERMLYDSAREAEVLKESGGNFYLAVEPSQLVPVHQSEVLHPTKSNNGFSGPTLSRPHDYEPPPPYRQSAGAEDIGALVISEQDLAEFGDDEFEEVWRALGKVFRVRGRRKAAQQKETARRQSDDKPS